MESRSCNVCGDPFPLTAEFWHRHKKGLNGFSQTCKECAKERARKWAEDNRERRLERVRDYAARTRKPGSRREEYEKGREHILEYQRLYYEENAERVKQRVREYVAENREKVAEAKRLAHIENRDADNARCLAWAAANPEKVRAAVAKYKARRRGAPGRITEADVLLQYERQRGTCFYCPASLAQRNFHVDHYHPLSRGGSNEPTNIVLACPPCNLAKHDKLPSEFKPPRSVE